MFDGRIFHEAVSRSDNATNQLRNAGRVGRMLTLTAASLLFAAGCGEKRVEVFPATGKVTFDGEIPVGGQIVLHPADPANAVGVAPRATVKPDGSFTITAYESGDGAPPGDYVVTLEWYKMTEEDGGAGPNVVPKKFTDPKQSPIKVTINAGAPTTLEPIKIVSK